MLQACALDFNAAWDEHLALIKFPYKNSYHSSLGMTLYEALYGRKCRTLLCWQDINKSLPIGSNLIQATADKIRVIQERMKTEHSC